jgi:DNA modification methylase
VQASPHHHRAPRTRRSRRSSAGPETSSQRAAISVRPRQSSGRPASITRAPRGLLAGITWRAIGDLKPYPNNPRRHPESQIAGLMKSIDLVWTNPILIDESATILAGHCRLEAAKRLGMADVPTITIAGLSDSEKRAIVIADNRLPERAVWDFDLLREHFRNLIEVDFEVELSGFTTGEIDLVMDGKPAPITANDPADDLTGFTLSGPAVSHLGDIWELGRHRLVCGDALRREDYEQLLGGDLAQMLVSDPPYNVKIDGHAMGRGKVRHREFAMASGEMSEAAYANFLDNFLCLATRFSRDGSIHYVFMDWRHMRALLNAAHPHYSELKNILAWNKTNAGQGSFYRSKHELIAVFKNGTAAHVNNFGLGGQGRYRTNVLDYPGVNSLHPARRGDLELHPTVKPVALIADLIRDCSRRNGIILDPFGGSGTTILAAERTGRMARVIELDPLYVDVAIHRWERITGARVRHVNTGLSFAEVQAKGDRRIQRSLVLIHHATARTRGNRS